MNQINRVNKLSNLLVFIVFMDLKIHLKQLERSSNQFNKNISINNNVQEFSWIKVAKILKKADNKLKDQDKLQNLIKIHKKWWKLSFLSILIMHQAELQAEFQKHSIKNKSAKQTIQVAVQTSFPRIQVELVLVFPTITNMIIWVSTKNRIVV